MKLFKYILISALLHLAVISAFSFKRTPFISFEIRRGDVSLMLSEINANNGGISSPAKKKYDDTGKNKLAIAKRKDIRGLSEDDGDDNSPGEGGIYGALGRLVAQAYGNNPPVYPAIARAMGYQGKVTLTLEVLPDGRCGSVEIIKSSGYKVLDIAAMNAAKGWIFFTNNSITLASPVIVSQDIIFFLKTY